jgi:hypothetical protein
MINRRRLRRDLAGTPLRKVAMREITRRGCVEDLPQAEGCGTPKAGRPKQGHKKPQKQMEKIVIQGGGRGKKKEREGHQD